MIKACFTAAISVHVSQLLLNLWKSAGPRWQERPIRDAQQLPFFSSLEPPYLPLGRTITSQQQSSTAPQ